MGLKTLRPTGALLLAAGILCVPGSGASQVLTGVLLERGTDEPVDLALVTLLDMAGDSADATLTDEQGRFRLEAPAPGEYGLSATGLGYLHTVAGSLFSLPEGSSMAIEFRIQPRAIEIGGITVETRTRFLDEPTLVQNGFVERAQRGFGAFITPGDLEKTDAYGTADLLARTGRVTTSYSMYGDRIVMRGTRGYCMPTVWVDGIRASLQATPIDQIVPLHMIYAAEVYRSESEAPARFSSAQSGCGVIVIWTKGR